MAEQKTNGVKKLEAASKKKGQLALRDILVEEPVREPKQLELSGVLVDGPAKEKKEGMSRDELISRVALGGLFVGMFFAISMAIFQGAKQNSRTTPEAHPGSSICMFKGKELRCDPRVKENAELEAYIARLANQVNMGNPSVVKLLEMLKYEASTIPSTSTAVGTYGNSEKLVTVYSDAVGYGSRSNVTVHEFLHSAFARYFDDAGRAGIASVIMPFVELAKQMDKEMSIPWLEYEMGKLGPEEITFLGRIRRYMDFGSVKSSPVEETFCYLAEERDAGMPPQLLPFYSQVLSQEYIANHVASPHVRFEKMICFYYWYAGIVRKQSPATLFDEPELPLPVCGE